MRHKKILLIEDEVPLQENICTLLEIQGYEVTCASNGEQGLQEVMKRRPDLILCDIMMPVMDGLEMVKAVRSTKGLAGLPFVFLTAKADKADLRLGMNLGADDYLTKPFTAKELLDTVNNRLERSEQVASEFEEKLTAARTGMNRISSHEFMTPLSGILAATTLLKEYPDSFSHQESVALYEDIHMAGLRLKRTLENLLIYNLLQKEANGALPEEYREGTTRVKNAAMRAVSQTVASTYETRRNVLIDMDETDINISHTAFAKIAEELLDNAFKFSKTSQVISLRGHIGEEGYVFSVHNEGSYFKPHYIEQIGPYRQFEREVYEQQGMGMGLFIVRELAGNAGGHISFTSSLTAGTTATVVLPLCR